MLQGQGLHLAPGSGRHSELAVIAIESRREKTKGKEEEKKHKEQKRSIPLPPLLALLRANGLNCFPPLQHS